MNHHHSLEIGWHFGWPIRHSHQVPLGRSDKTWKGRQEKHSLFGERKAQGKRPKRLESRMQNELCLKQIHPAKLNLLLKTTSNPRLGFYSIFPTVIRPEGKLGSRRSTIFSDALREFPRRRFRVHS